MSIDASRENSFKNIKGKAPPADPGKKSKVALVYFLGEKCPGLPISFSAGGKGRKECARLYTKNLGI